MTKDFQNFFFSHWTGAYFAVKIRPEGEKSPLCLRLWVAPITLPFAGSDPARRLVFGNVGNAGLHSASGRKTAAERRLQRVW